MEILVLDQENFETEVLSAEGAVLVDFWAPWCVYCRRLSPVMERLSQKEDFVRIGTVNIDEQPELEERYDIRVIPTLMLFKNGEPGEKLIAPASQRQVEDFVARQLEE